ncbi:MAG: rhomboid family intramembrane serine protease [Candidatus Aenigmarchaeota archaeon]|nr:rhomboid family intramembrane serine protease [Candidatus Aenigmarchaeota archaeon]
MKYVSLIIVLLCVSVFALELLYGSMDNFILVGAEVAEKPWMIVTHMFLHASFQHLFYNMFALGLFGFILENIIGSKRFLLIYFAAGLASAFISLPFYEASLGASGAIFGILGCLAVLRPKMFVWVIGVPMPMIAAAALWIIIDLVGVFYPSNVANIAHLAGMAAGIAAGLLLRKSTHAERQFFINDKEIENWENDWMT